MQKLLFIYIALLSAFTVSANSADSLLHVLDKTVKERYRYVDEKIERLDILKRELDRTSDPEQKFRICQMIFDNYKTLQMDSALAYVYKRIEIADELNDPQSKQFAQLNLAEALIITGMYKEAFEILQAKSGQEYDREERNYLYHIIHSLYLLMSDYTLSMKEREEYLTLQYQYKDSILSVLAPDERGYMLTKSSVYLEKEDYNGALQMAEKAYQTFNKDPHDIALCAHTLSEVYHQMGDYENEKKYLIISAIADLQGGIKEYISLRKVSGILYKEGDISRAYDYIKCSMEDAIYCNARYRTLEISQMLPIINDTYDIRMKNDKQRLLFFLIIISVLSVFLVLAILFIFRQLKALLKARQSLKEMNDDLKEVNNNLQQLNIELSESNIVKEEYIGYVFNLCSAYIDKLEEFRKKVNRKLKAGQSKEVVTMTSSSSLVADELKELYRNFDLIFLNLYPDFIEDFNSLLMENENIYPKEGELLSPELRIYALVRLGINDSVKIASFLHYSPQTVYNYRLKVRNKAKIAKENFPEAVRQLGKIRK